MSIAVFHPERDDDHKPVITHFGPNSRIIDGLCGIPSVIQAREGRTKSGVPRRTGRSNGSIRATLIRRYRSSCARADAEVLAIPKRLKDWHPRWGGNV